MKDENVAGGKIIGEKSDYLEIYFSWSNDENNLSFQEYFLLIVKRLR